MKQTDVVSCGGPICWMGDVVALPRRTSTTRTKQSYRGCRWSCSAAWRAPRLRRLKSLHGRPLRSSGADRLPCDKADPGIIHPKRVLFAVLASCSSRACCCS